MGIEKNNFEEIFEPFVTSKESGDGFGLYMARLIIEEKMGGVINATNVKNGAKFLICLKKENVDYEDIIA